MKRTKLSFIGVLIVLSLMLTPGVHASPVTVQITPTSQAVPQGTIASYTVGLSGAPPTNPKYVVSLSGLVPGASYSFSSTLVTMSAGSGSTGLTMDASSTPLFCPGIYPFTVTAHNSTNSADPGSASGTLVVVQVGPNLAFAVSTDKSTYRVGDKVVIQDSANRPAEARLTITPPSGSTSIVYEVFYGASTYTHTISADTIGRYTVNIQGDDFCNIFNTATVYFDVTPNTYDVSISVGGIPAQISIPITVDGQSQGSMLASDIKKLSFPIDTTHNIGLPQTVNGDSGVRYTSAQNTWTVNAPGSHTFQYTTEFMFTVGTDPDGVTQVTGGAWSSSGSSVQTSQAPATVAGPPGTKYVFKGWMVDGVLQSGNPISITLDKPHKAIATYVTQYQLVVDSAYGNPKGSDYYQAGSTATFSVSSPAGFLIQQVFTNWTGDYNGTSPTGSITMDKPHTVHANWGTSYLQLGILIAAIVAVAVVAALLLWRRRGTAAPPETKPTPTTAGEPGSGGSPTSASSAGVKCSSCGADVAPGLQYCENCGTNVSQN